MIFARLNIGLSFDLRFDPNTPANTPDQYVDDIEVARDTQGRLKASDGDLSIGCGSQKTPDSYWFGMIDDVRIDDRAIVP